MTRTTRDRVATVAGLVLITAVAWLYVVRQTGTMHAPMGGMQEPMGEPGLRVAMWLAMMIAMMVPTAAPMTLVYAAVARKAAAQNDPVAPTFVFVGGYVAVWSAFSLVAAFAQTGLERAALLSPMLVSSSPALGAGILVAAGVYQLTPLKNACLEHCRAPAHFISRHWRSGVTGAFRMGLRHGAYCLGCCWVLMGLLFVGGVMNLLWVAAIAVFVLLEKTIPFGATGGRLAGGAMILLGVLSLAGVVSLG